MGDDFSVGFGQEPDALVLKLAAELGKIFDDAIMHYRHFFGGVRMRVVFRRPAMGRPTGMTDTDRAVQRLALQSGFEILEFAFGATPRELAALQCRDTRGIIAAIFEALERIDQMRRSRVTADDSDNAAHISCQ